MRVVRAIVAWAAACAVVAVMLVGIALATPATLVCAVSDRAGEVVLRCIDWWIEHTGDRAIEWAARVTWGRAPCE